MVDLNDPAIQKVEWNAGKVLMALQLAGLSPPFCDDFPEHWSDGLAGEGWYTGVRLGRVWVAPSHDRTQRNWFNSIEEADAWVLACWRMK
jgi:hypothetical protein